MGLFKEGVYSNRNFMIPVAFAAPGLTIDGIFPFPQSAHNFTFLINCLILQQPLLSQPSQIIIPLSQEKCIKIPRIGEIVKVAFDRVFQFFGIAACHYVAQCADFAIPLLVINYLYMSLSLSLSIYMFVPTFT